MNRGSFYWRNTARRPKFLWFFDYLTVVFFLIFILHIRSWTFFLAVFSMIAFSVLAHFGFTIGLLIRRIGFLLGGKTRPSRGWWHWDRLSD